MIQKVLHSIQPYIAYGIAINTNSQDVQVVSLKRLGDDVSIINSSSYSGINEAIEAIPKEVLLGIFIEGKGIITKSTTTTDIASALNQVLPNAKITDFYHQQAKINSVNYFSVARKETIDSISKHFNTHFISKINIDIISTKACFELLGHNFEANQITIGEEKLEKPFYSAFSAAFCTIADLSNYSIQNKLGDNAKNEFIQKRIFQLASSGLLVFCLLLLLGNYFLLHSYSNKNASLSYQSDQYQSLNLKKKKLKTTIATREKFLNESGWTNHYYTSKLADDIGSTVPKSILLNELSFNPIDLELSRRERKEVYSANTAVVKGLTNSPSSLNEWIEKLEVMNNIQHVKIDSYEYDSRKRIGIFELSIDTK